ncbi:MAG: iron-containing alcohol dehydrogenase [Geminicoccaceae bacterium]|nr:iron-containing alcohol dehydrogenase [Geminicoccaceae bacterium]
MSEHDRIINISQSPITFGRGALVETGDIARSFGLTRVLLMTDPHMAASAHVDTVRHSLSAAGLQVEIYAGCEVEPTDRSLMVASRALGDSSAEGIVSVGGGSVMDTAKAANLYATHPAEFLDYVNAPIGKGIRPPGPLRPHIACPTTCGTGSECTGIAVFDLLSMKAKTGIMSRRMLPDHAIVDPDATVTLPRTALTSTALDALCHAMEAYTCRPASTRERPATASARPMTQGANRWSDEIAAIAIRGIACHFGRAALDPADDEAREALMWASTMAGTAFGNSGCHVPHAMSYSVSGLVRDYRPADYPPGPPLIPHGLSVILNAPAVYRLTGAGAPERHAQLADWLGAADDGAPPGERVARWLVSMMRLAGLPGGLADIGYSPADIPQLVKGALPQRRLLDNAPAAIDRARLEDLYAEAMVHS